MVLVAHCRLYRLRGELLLQHAVAQPGEAEACFQQALAIVRRQQAKSLELRAATSLARLWQQQGQRTAAYTLLAPITAGSPRGSTRLTSKTPGCYWRSWVDSTGEHTTLHCNTSPKSGS